MQLLDEVMAAYGGAERWQQIDTISIHQKVGGVLWTLKEVGGILDDSMVRIAVHEPRAWHYPLPRAGFHSSFSPERVLIETDADRPEVVESLVSPRESFAGHTLETPWSHLQLAYFAGYAMWTYLSEPSSLTLPGVQTDELGEWREDGQTWRRLGVRYPNNIATHSSEQVLYVDSDGLIRRRDYQVDIAGGAPSAHYCSEFRASDGIVLPFKRVVYSRDESGHHVPEPIIVSIDVQEVTIE